MEKENPKKLRRARRAFPQKLYYTISEVCQEVELKPHVLRYWETEFKELRPKKGKARNRLYRKKDIELIKEIKKLLYDEKYTIEGARKKIRQLTQEEAIPLPFVSENYEKTIRLAIKKVDEIIGLLKGEGYLDVKGIGNVKLSEILKENKTVSILDENDSTSDEGFINSNQEKDFDEEDTDEESEVNEDEDEDDFEEFDDEEEDFDEDELSDEDEVDMDEENNEDSDEQDDKF